MFTAAFYIITKQKNSFSKFCLFWILPSFGSLPPYDRSETKVIMIGKEDVLENAPGIQ